MGGFYPDNTDTSKKPHHGQKVRLYTDCGELLLQGAAVERVAQAVERVLYARLRQLEGEAWRGRRTRCKEPRARYGSGGTSVEPAGRDFRSFAKSNEVRID